MHCCDTQGLLPVETALSYMREQIQPSLRFELLSVSQAHNRILAQDIVSPLDVPPYDNSAMDGYALSVLANCTQYKVVGKAFAGQPFQGAIKAGECVRIMTGAVVPNGANSVVMQENTQINGDFIELTEPAQLAQNIRLKGDDIYQGQVILNRGQVLKPAEIGLLASLGLEQVKVYQKIKVGLFTTGDELKQAGEALMPGQIYDSNRPMLKAMLDNAYIDIIDLGVIADTFADIKQAFIRLSTSCDAIISSGGVSVGEADYTKQVIDQIGKINFWKLAIKPGKPFAFGTLGEAIFFGLPGNPVSSYVTFEQLVKPNLAYLAGADNVSPNLILDLPLIGQIKKRAGRKDFQRGKLVCQNGKIIGVEPTPKQSSGVLSSVSKADCYIILEAESCDFKEGDSVKVQPF
ncbi:molybdopterin molybdotransferase MoeA [Catenovulum sp. 2E275]|uniref:molybdopterin molybdotransferase MoeA n=1 Tax=Catenovulum sp. 2E275 TaxID=2980497 RepID=UPI0021D01F23|nr:gephyrin-like molybdotransferase Glp [Catenovulum sp. 2E275]MCU4676411.1 molybdopterin molybdotransferase MoeA [Catenovulum sp. 2E275]